MANIEAKKKDLSYRDIDHVNNFICENHDDIYLLCKDILKLFDTVDIQKTPFLSTEISELVNIILDRTKQAKSQGIKMEKRLLKYRKAIQKLGFARVDSSSGV